ncbi:hypothetical protein RFI_33820, partial [Reticulomyxa filosa]
MNIIDFLGKKKNHTSFIININFQVYLSFLVFEIVKRIFLGRKSKFVDPIGKMKQSQRFMIKMKTSSNDEMRKQANDKNSTNLTYLWNVSLSSQLLAQCKNKSQQYKVRVLPELEKKNIWKYKGKKIILFNGVQSQDNQTLNVSPIDEVNKYSRIKRKLIPKMLPYRNDCVYPRKQHLIKIFFHLKKISTNRV